MGTCDIPIYQRITKLCNSPIGQFNDEDETSTINLILSPPSCIFLGFFVETTEVSSVQSRERTAYLPHSESYTFQKILHIDFVLTGSAYPDEMPPFADICFGSTPFAKISSLHRVNLLSMMT